MTNDYRPRIERALGHIAQHLGEPLPLKEVARAAHLSEFHFHRIFSAVMGEPVGRYITRKRLELSALRLAYETRRSVTEIALLSGYSTTSNFSKAFSAHFGCSPSRVRKRHAMTTAPIDLLTARHGRSFSPADLHVLPEDASTAERSIELRSLQAVLSYRDFAGLDVAALASPEGYDFDGVMRTWDALIAAAYAHGFAQDDIDAFGLAYDSPQLTDSRRCRYHACVPCPRDAPLSAGLFRGKIPAGRYAIFRYAGSVAGLEKMYRRIYSVWLPASRVTVDDFTAVEHYVGDAPQAGQVDMEIWIKVLQPI